MCWLSIRAEWVGLCLSWEEIFRGRLRLFFVGSAVQTSLGLLILNLLIPLTLWFITNTWPFWAYFIAITLEDVHMNWVNCLLFLILVESPVNIMTNDFSVSISRCFKDTHANRGIYNSWVTKPSYKTELRIMTSQTELLTLKNFIF